MKMATMIDEYDEGLGCGMEWTGGEGAGGLKPARGRGIGHMRHHGAWELIAGALLLLLNKPSQYIQC